MPSSPSGSTSVQPPPVTTLDSRLGDRAAEPGRGTRDEPDPLTAAAVVTAVLAAVGELFPGMAMAVAVAVGGAVAGVFSERGRAQLAGSPAGVEITRVERLDDPIGLRVHRAAAVDGDPVPPFVARDKLPELVDALRAGGFVLVVGDSTAGKTRLAFEAMKTCLPKHICVIPDGTVPGTATAAVTAAVANRPSVVWLDDLDRYLGTGGLTPRDVRTLAGRQVVVLATIRARTREHLSERNDLARDHAGRQVARAGRDVLDSVTTEVRLPRRCWSAKSTTP